MEIKTFQKYLFNCFLLTIPILLWDYVFTDKLPKAFQLESFWKEVHWSHTLYMFWAIAILFVGLLPKVRNFYKK